MKDGNLNWHKLGWEGGNHFILIEWFLGGDCSIVNFEASVTNPGRCLNGQLWKPLIVQKRLEKTFSGAREKSCCVGSYEGSNGRLGTIWIFMLSVPVIGQVPVFSLFPSPFPHPLPTFELFLSQWSVRTQFCLTLWDPMDCSLPGSSVHGILQARILEWVAISSSRGCSWLRDWT